MAFARRLFELPDNVQAKSSALRVWVHVRWRALLLAVVGTWRFLFPVSGSWFSELMLMVFTFVATYALCDMLVQWILSLSPRM